MHAGAYAHGAVERAAAAVHGIRAIANLDWIAVRLAVYRGSRPFGALLPAWHTCAHMRRG